MTALSHRARASVVTALVLIAAGVAAADDYSYQGRIRYDNPELVTLRKRELQPLGACLRIASYNLQDFSDAIKDGDARTPAQAQNQAQGAALNLSEIDPDIAIVEEVENDRALGMLNQRMKKPYPFAAITRFASKGDYTEKLNIAVLSRLPLAGLREMDFGYLEGPGRPPRGLLSFMVDLGDDRRLLVYGVHLKSNYGEQEKDRAKRRNAMSILVNDAESVRAKYPKFQWEVLVAGDTNVDPDDSQFATDPSFEPLKGWIDLWRGIPLPERVTLPTRLGDPTNTFPAVTFDRFFVSPEMTNHPWVVGVPHSLQRGTDTNSVFTLPGDNGHVSDHYPIYLDLAR